MIMKIKWRISSCDTCGHGTIKKGKCYPSEKSSTDKVAMYNNRVAVYTDGKVCHQYVRWAALPDWETCGHED